MYGLCRENKCCGWDKCCIDCEWIEKCKQNKKACEYLYNWEMRECGYYNRNTSSKFKT